MTGAASNKVFAADIMATCAAQTVGIRTSSTTNAYGERSFSGSVVQHPAYLKRSTTNAEGFDDTVIVEYEVNIPSTTLAVDTNDEITLPSPISGIRPILRAEAHNDVNGQVGVTLYLGRVSR